MNRQHFENGFSFAIIVLRIILGSVLIVDGIMLANDNTDFKIIGILVFGGIILIVGRRTDINELLTRVFGKIDKTLSG